jgi:hypothetical protein
MLHVNICAVSLQTMMDSMDIFIYILYNCFLFRRIYTKLFFIRVVFDSFLHRNAKQKRTVSQIIKRFFLSLSEYSTSIDMFKDCFKKL